MTKRILIILGAVVLLGVGGCVGTGYHGGAYYRSDGYDPWYYGRYPYAGYSSYFSYPGYFYYPRYRHYPVIFDKRPYIRHDHQVIIDKKPGIRHDQRIVKEKNPSGQHFFNKDTRRDDYRDKRLFDRQLTREDRRQKSHDANRYEQRRDGRPDRSERFTRPHRGLKCIGARC